MIKIKVYEAQLHCFLEFLNQCINGHAKTGDTVKEFYFDYNLDQLRLRISKKLFEVHNNREIKKYSTISIKILRPEVVALSIYFNRYEVHPFIKSVETLIIKQIPAELIKVLNPNKIIANVEQN